MASVLILGATGYVGGRLVPQLLNRGYSVRCLVRDPRKLSGKSWHKDVEVIKGDLLGNENIRPAFDGIDTVYYLVHSMAAGEGRFEELDRKAAQNVSKAAETHRVGRIIYLGGLGRRDIPQSPHLRSRHQVGDTLRMGRVPVIEFRAAVIIGSGSLSFEIIHHLVNRLPMMICPRWVYTRTQPIAIADVLEYLTDACALDIQSSRVFDIGGPDVMSYRDMMIVTARVLGLKRLLLQVPVLTPRLSSYWVNLVTPIPSQVARSLIESLKYETICENDDALTEFDIKPMNFDVAVSRALARVRSLTVETRWTDASSVTEWPAIDKSHLHEDKRTIEVNAPVHRVFSVVSSIGGDRGWYYADWMWKFRGFIDKQLGGVGLRRGRRHPNEITVGEALDFWRVEEFIPNEKLTLHAEMKVWGQAWLEFSVVSIGQRKTLLTQIARYYPRGITGLVYWYSVYPAHALVFRGMIRAIARKAEKLGGDTSNSERGKGAS
jgi:uncharacterized protein YbjT (DUF2867 family)